MSYIDKQKTIVPFNHFYIIHVTYKYLMTILPSHLYTKQVHRLELKKKLPFQDHNYFYEELTMLGTNRKQRERKNK